MESKALNASNILTDEREVELLNGNRKLPKIGYEKQNIRIFLKTFRC